MRTTRMADEDRISELLLRWEEAWEHGRDIPPAELCADAPDLAGPVGERIAALKEMAWVSGGQKPADDGKGAGGNEVGNIPGLLAGRYRIDGLIAQGGAGRVYRGYDLELQRPVAVKVPRRACSAADRSAGLLEEARKVAALRHPNIVGVHDVGRAGDDWFIVSDLIDGPSLADAIAGRRTFPAEAARIVAAVAGALHYAHERGFVHRDIKPSNILLDGQGRPMLTDFGIATTRAELDGGRVGVTTGTLPYMAPEQVAGEVQLIDARTDIYALGVVLYELLTGRQPYRGRTPTAVREQILFRPPVPVRSVEPAVPRRLERICLRCLAKHPADRYATAGVVAGELLAFVASAPLHRVAKACGIAGGVVLAGLLVVGGLILLPHGGRPPGSAERPHPASADGPGADDVTRAFVFDGSNRIVTPLERFSPVTLEAWVWPERYEDRCHFVIGSDVPKRYGVGLGVCGVLLSAEYAEGVVKSDATVPLRRWSHLAAVFGPSATRLYLNGRLVGTGPATKPVDGAKFVVGNVGPDNPIDYFLGRVRAVRISRGERYTGDFVPPETFTRDDPAAPARAVLIYGGGTVDGDVVTDLSGEGNHGRRERLPGP